MLQEMHGYQLYCADTHASTYTKTLQLKTPVISRASHRKIQIWFRKAYGFISTFLHRVHANMRMVFLEKGHKYLKCHNSLTLKYMLLDCNDTSSDKLL